MSDLSGRTPSLPDAVREWLDDTYTPEGQAIWLRAFEKADPAKRAQMLALALTPEMGT